VPAMATMALARLVELASSVVGRGELAALGGGAVVIDLEGEGAAADGAAPTADGHAPGAVADLPVVVVGVAPGAGTPADRGLPGADLVDIVVGDDAAAARVVAAVDARPLAATALALLLRGSERRTVPEGLVAESATYSLLQFGPEHVAWLGRRGPPRVRERDERPLRVRREGDGGPVLHITLDRPAVRNAYDAAMRDALLDALAVAQADPAVRVVLDGAGPSFCSGGDLDEFGTRRDPASAHLVRLGRSAGHALHLLADRVTARVHGASVGSGVELAAFAGRVVAAPDATFALPEVAMGLVPGAGGTVSIPGRIGRHRTAWLALTGERIDAPTAREWGLVDEIVDEVASVT
jgi:enoyl-CoA hydratase/carnithine racemase